MEKIKKCIICSSIEHLDYLKCTDYLVSKEAFLLKKCSKCGFVFTSPRPEADKIQPYYKSENYYSHADDNKSVVSFLYNKIRDINIKRKLNLIKKSKPNRSKLLDYGCGAGLFIKAAIGQGWVALGVEPNVDARIVTEKMNLSVVPPDALDSFEEKSFDVITLWHVLEHIHDLENTIAKLKSLLKSDGVFVIAVPNLESWDARKYREKWAAYDVPRHLYHFSPKTIELLFAKFGMTIASKHPMKFDSFYVSLLSENKSLLAYLRAILNGWVSNLHARSSGNYSSIIYFIQ